MGGGGVGKAVGEMSRSRCVCTLVLGARRAGACVGQVGVRREGGGGMG